jgi:HSP20 family protein
MNNALVYHPATWLDQFFTDFDKGYARKNDFTPAVDVVEEKENFVLRAELPGVTKENIKVEVKENRLTLSGKKENAWTERGGHEPAAPGAGAQGARGDYRYTESSFGSFSRSFEIPRNVSGEAIKAEFVNGVLTLRIPKAKEALSRLIDIQ